MKGRDWIRRAGRMLGWLSAVLVALMLLSGYGMAQFRTVEAWTLGLLGKAAAQRWHELLGVPVLAAALAHILAVMISRRLEPKEGGRK